jgi:hypothetical protein
MQSQASVPRIVNRITFREIWDRYRGLGKMKEMIEMEEMGK